MKITHEISNSEISTKETSIDNTNAYIQSLNEEILAIDKQIENYVSGSNGPGVLPS